MDVSRGLSEGVFTLIVVLEALGVLQGAYSTGTIVLDPEQAELFKQCVYARAPEGRWSFNVTDPTRANQTAAGNGRRSLLSRGGGGGGSGGGIGGDGGSGGGGSSSSGGGNSAGKTGSGKGSEVSWGGYLLTDHIAALSSQAAREGLLPLRTRVLGIGTHNSLLSGMLLHQKRRPRVEGSASSPYEPCSSVFNELDASCSSSGGCEAWQGRVLPCAAP